MTNKTDAEKLQEIMDLKDKPVKKLDIIAELKAPFQKIHYRPKTCYNGKLLLLAYLDARDVMKRLDDVIGFDKWKDDYKEIKGNLFCTISIYLNGQWISKTDCGIESNIDAKKGESSDAFKRVAVKWGIGRYLYYLPKLQTTIEDKGQNYIKIQDKATNKTVSGYYNDPVLPVWAVAKKENNK